MSFVVEFPLKTESWQRDILNKRFSIAEHMYNSLLNVTFKRYREMKSTKEYRNLVSLLSNDKNSNKSIYRQINDLRKRYGLSEYAFHSDIKYMQKHFKENIDSFTAQKIATHLWKSYEKMFFSNGNHIHYKKKGSLKSVEGKSNRTGIIFKNDILYWKGLEMPVIIDYRNAYECEAITQHDISYCRIVRRYGKRNIHFNVQIIFKGTPPVKYDIQTGEVRHPLGNGDVGIDIGTSTIAVTGEHECHMQELAEGIKNIEREVALIQRKIERSRRAMNPDNYNEDGTIKKERKKWTFSKRYMKLLFRLRYLSQKHAFIRKQKHETLANKIISMGDTVYVENMDFKALASRSKKTEVSEKTGRYKRKKRYGKSIGNRAPAMVLAIIDRKLHYHGKEIVEINTIKARASQYNHISDNYKKKSLSQRWHEFDDGTRVQRDLYSSYLIMNTNNTHDGFDKEKCDKRFDEFIKNHNMEIERLKTTTHVSSMGLN